MDYKICASQILKEIGGSKNLISAAHCATRMRLVIADNFNVNKTNLENIEGVKGVFEASGQLQIIIGTGTVNKVYDEFIKIAGISASTKSEVKQAAASRASWPKRCIKTLGDIFVPIIPAIVATGLLCGLLGGLSKAYPEITESNLYALLDMFSNTALTFLPILIAISAAKIFGGNVYLGAVIGMLMIHPNLINAWSVAGGDVETKTLWLWFDKWDIQNVGYQGHVIPIIISVWLMSVIEKKLHKIVPEMLDLFITPLCSVLIAGFMAMTVIGPIFATAETYVLNLAKMLVALPMGVGAFIIGGAYAPTVVAGVHHMYNAIEMMMLSDNGQNIWMPIATAANVAQGAAALAVAFKTRNSKTKSMAFPASLSAFLGITEPAIFGVNIRFVKPFIAGMIGGAAGALVASVTKVYATANGVTGVFGFLITTDSLVGYTLTFVVAAVVAFVCSWIMYKEDFDSKSNDKNTINKIENEKNTVYNAIQGQVVELSSIDDETFSSGVLGEGYAIDPSQNIVYAPFNGKVTMTFDTKHAIGLKSDDGIEILIHVGMNTVNLGGQHYKVFVKEGQTVKLGQKLMEFDMNAISSKGYSLITPVIVTNTDDYASINILRSGNTNVGEEIIKIDK